LRRKNSLQIRDPDLGVKREGPSSPYKEGKRGWGPEEYFTGKEVTKAIKKGTANFLVS